MCFAYFSRYTVDCLVTLLLAYSILGIHVVQPLFALKCKNNTSYQKLILLCKSVIGDNLTNTEAEKLLDNSVSKSIRIWDLRSVCSPTLAKLQSSKNGVDENLTR